MEASPIQDLKKAVKDGNQDKVLLPSDFDMQRFDDAVATYNKMRQNKALYDPYAKYKLADGRVDVDAWARAVLSV